MEGGRVNHSKCMCVVSHGYYGLGGGRDGGGGLHACGTKPWVACQEMPEHFLCVSDILMTPDHTAIQVRSSGLGRAGIGRSFWKGLSTGRHDKAPVHCPYSRLATLHGASWMQLL